MSEPSAIRLPLACEALYLRDFMAPDDAWSLFHLLREDYDVEPGTLTLADGSEWREETGKLMFVEPRLADPSVFPAEHGRRAPWPTAIEALSRRVGAVTGCDHPVCVAIYYPDGRAGVDYHSDPPAFGDTRAIASISLGCERRFGIRDLEGQAEDYVMRLAHGSLLTMGPGFQDRYAHAILLEETCTEPRINLTFRCFG
jgi:alkylated DNA repair dioxygenase AlkB